jgi:hypothetical protein
MTVAANRIRTVEFEIFQRQCLELIDEVYEHDLEIVVIRNGEPFVRIIRYFDEKTAPKRSRNPD